MRILKQIEDKVYDMIVKSPDGKLNLERIIPIAEAVKDVVVSDVQKKQITDQGIKLNPIAEAITGAKSQSIQVLGDGSVATADTGAKIEDILGEQLITSLSPLSITVTPALILLLLILLLLQTLLLGPIDPTATSNCTTNLEGQVLVIFKSKLK